MRGRTLPAESPIPLGSPPINLASVDLNLLTAFDALMREGQVSRAAAMVGRSQSAMSHTLARLRDLFGDDLFIRTNKRLMPTPRALELAELITPALASVRTAFDSQTMFDPRLSQRHFVIGMSDLASFVILPKIMPALRQQAPLARLTVMDMASHEGVADILSGSIELAIGYFPELPVHIQGAVIASLDTVGLADRNNIYLDDGKMSFESFLSAPHIMATVGSDLFGTHIDRYLSARGDRRQIALEISSYLSIPSAVRGTDLVATIERHTVPRLPDCNDLVTFELPFREPDSSVLAIWHKRHQNDPAHQWLRNLVIPSAIR